MNQSSCEPRQWREVLYDNIILAARNRGTERLSHVPQQGRAAAG
jgi:hypothetical protein